MDSSPCLSNWAAVTRLLKEELSTENSENKRGEQDLQQSFETGPAVNLPLHLPSFAILGQLVYLSMHLALSMHLRVASKYLHEAQQA